MSAAMKETWLVGKTRPGAPGEVLQKRGRDLHAVPLAGHTAQRLGSRKQPTDDFHAPAPPATARLT
eukprot:1833741-Lingulodinium_polyedra.AAC.1